MVICSENRRKQVLNQDKPKTFLQKVDSVYQDKMPGALGFFTLATPLAAAADTWKDVPASNGLANRMLITAVGLAGLQHLVSLGREEVYDFFNIYYRSEAAKRATDFTYGATVGAILNPTFHQVTQKLLNLEHIVPLQDSIITGGVVGGITGLVGWLASDAYAHSWEIKNTPSRSIKIPGAQYLKSLPKRVKKTLALGATLLSLGGTAEYYAHRYCDEQAKAIYQHRIEQPFTN
jgi:hypothetical protein